MQTYIIGQTLVFDKANRLLLLTRSLKDTHAPGSLDLPGGRIDPGEEYLSGALRELKEEAGLIVPVTEMRLAYSMTKTGMHSELDRNISWVRLVFICRLESPEIVLSHEHDDYGWYTFDQAINADYPVLQKVLGYLQNNDVMSQYWKTAS